MNIHPATETFFLQCTHEAEAAITDTSLWVDFIHQTSAPLFVTSLVTSEFLVQMLWLANCHNLVHWKHSLVVHQLVDTFEGMESRAKWKWLFSLIDSALVRTVTTQGKYKQNIIQIIVK